MAWKSTLIKPFAHIVAKGIDRWAARAVEIQDQWMHQLVAAAKDTAFGRDHQFHTIRHYDDFKQRVPIRDYEALRPYFDRIIAAEPNVTWKGLPKYFAKTSGTTSGTKYIPITPESIPNHFGTARNMVFNYIARTGKADFFDGKLMFLSGSPELTQTNGILTGRLSGISNHMVPAWLKLNQMPSYQTNCIDDWETKLEHIVRETYQRDMRLISGIPPWVQMYYERLLDQTGKKTVLEVFPHLSMFIYGGVNFEPYRAQLEQLVGARIPSLETYPASEGFIAFQDQPNELGLLLNVNSGIFYEFVKADEFFDPNPTRVSLADVQTGINYAILINNNAGLWGYNIGDTVQFLSTHPPRIVVSGRIKHFISAFGEHVIGKEVEEALLSVANQEGVRIVEFTVAPQVNPTQGLPFHEWFIEFDNLPDNLHTFAQKIDHAMTLQNIYYKDLIVGNILRPLVIRPLQRDTFRQYMKAQGKLGGQNKVPRLANDRKIADQLQQYCL
jgi:hypothetical protein